MNRKEGSSLLRKTRGELGFEEEGGFSGGRTSREGKELEGGEERGMVTMDLWTYFIDI